MASARMTPSAAWTALVTEAEYAAHPAPPAPSWVETMTRARLRTLNAACMPAAYPIVRGGEVSYGWRPAVQVAHGRET